MYLNDECYARSFSKPGFELVANGDRARIKANLAEAASSVANKRIVSSIIDLGEIEIRTESSSLSY
jgi:hypothetical protein